MWIICTIFPLIIENSYLHAYLLLHGYLFRLKDQTYTTIWSPRLFDTWEYVGWIEIDTTKASKTNVRGIRGIKKVA